MNLSDLLSAQKARANPMLQYYEIRMKGHLDFSWSDWLDGMTITHEAGGTTLLSGKVVDQAALHGLLNKLRDLNVQLISVNPVQTPPGTDSTIDAQ